MASKITTAEASLNADICHYFVVSWSNCQESDVGYNTRDITRDWQTNPHLYLAYIIYRQVDGPSLD